MISLKQAKRLKCGDILYHVSHRNADRTPEQWRVNGKVKTWKRSPDRVRIPVKHGLYDYDYLTEHDLILVNSTYLQAMKHKV